MMDMTPIAQAVLVYTALAVAVLATALTSFAQLRELPKALARGRDAALVRRGFLAASVGMGSVGGSILALEIAGPGAIAWMWIASLLGMGLIYAELRVALRHRRRMDATGRREVGTVHALATLPGGRVLATLFALVFVLFALTAGSLLQTQQGAELLAPLGGSRALVVATLVAAAGLGMAVPKLRRFVAALGPVAVVLYVIATAWIVALAPGDAGAAFAAMITGASGREVVAGVAGGGLLVVMQAGVLRATLATEAGLGSAGFTPEADGVRNPEQAAASAMLAPLISGIVVPTMTALAVLTATPWVGQRLDEPGERLPSRDGREASAAELVELAAAFADGDSGALDEADRTRVVAPWMPLERPQSRGARASLQAGQTLVLPVDAVAAEDASAAEAEGRLLENHVYPFVMRANPRGLRVRLASEASEVTLPLVESTQVARELVFRDRDPERGKLIAYDLRIPVDNRTVERPGSSFVRLRPSDPSVDLQRLAKAYDGPYAVVGDYHFEGRVVAMYKRDELGFHYSIVEAEAAANRSITLRTAVQGGFRGPYFDAGEPRPPMALISREDFEAPVGARVRLEYRAPARGLELGELSQDGALVTPAWRLLTKVEEAILRHDEDPSLDRRIPVSHELVDGKLHFRSATPTVADFADAERWSDFSGPYLAVDPHRFAVEVHGGARLPASTAYLARSGEERRMLEGPFSARRSLVAVHPLGEPRGPTGELYDPHPAELAPFMDGPWVSGGGIERLALGAGMAMPPGGDVLLGIAVLLLALTTMIAWSTYGARAADFVFGAGAGVGFRLLFLLVGLGGIAVELLPILVLADHLMLALLALHGFGLVVLLLRDRRVGD